MGLWLSRSDAVQPGEDVGAAQPEHVRVPHTQGPAQGRQASRVRKKERKIFFFHAINNKQYDSSMYIIHTVVYFVFPRGKVYMYSTSWRGVRAPNQRIFVLVAMLGISLAERECRPGITKGRFLLGKWTGNRPHSCVSDPDWIRIQMGRRIRIGIGIRIQAGQCNCPSKRKNLKKNLILKSSLLDWKLLLKPESPLKDNF
jgi:hypothetical protein